MEKAPIEHVCYKHKTGDAVEARAFIDAPNGYKYEVIIRGKIVKQYNGHIRAGYHRYQVLFDKPRWVDSDKLLLDMIEHDLRFL